MCEEQFDNLVQLVYMLIFELEPLKIEKAKGQAPLLISGWTMSEFHRGNKLTSIYFRRATVCGASLGAVVGAPVGAVVGAVVGIGVGAKVGACRAELSVYWGHCAWVLPAFCRFSKLILAKLDRFFGQMLARFRLYRHRLLLLNIHFAILILSTIL